MPNFLLLTTLNQKLDHRRLRWAVFVICFTPLLLNSFGFSFGFHYPIQPVTDPHILSQFVTVGLAYLILNAVCCGMAFWIGWLAWRHWHLIRSPLMALTCAVFWATGLLDFLHASMAVEPGGDWGPRVDAIAWTWSLSRLFNALGLWATFSILSRPLSTKSFSYRFMPFGLFGIGIAFFLLAQWGFFFPLSGDAAFKQDLPLDLSALFLYAACAPLAWQAYQATPNNSFLIYFLAALWPQALAQLYICLGGTQFLSNGFDLAHGLKFSAYLLTLIGLFKNYFQAHREEIANWSLQQGQSIAQAADEGVLAVDEEEKIVFSNARAAKLFGYENNELLGKPLSHLMSASIKNAAENPVELSGCHKNGKNLSLLVNCRKMTDGTRDSLVCVIRDIAERKEWEGKLADRQKYYLSLYGDTHELAALLDAEGCLLDASPSFETGLGFHPQEVIGKRFVEMVHPDDFSGYQRYFHETLRRSAHSLTNLRMRNKNGTWQLMEITLRNLLDVHAVGGIVANFRDVTEAKKIERALVENMERYELVARGTNGGIWDWNLLTDEVYYSPRWKAILGHNDEEIGATPGEWLDRVHEDDREALENALTAHLNGTTPFLENEHRIRAKDGNYLWVFCRGLAVRNASGKSTRVAGSLIDISARKNSEELFRQQAHYDALTGLPNRTLFLNQLQHNIDLCKRRKNMRFAVLFLDLDRFKGVNDSLGHMMGDELLKETGRRLERCLRPMDMAARLGGDEFTVLLEDIKDAREAVQITARILKELSMPYHLNDQEVFATASVGIAMNTPDYSKPEELLRDADTAMYRAKANGKARYEVFDTDMHTRAVALLQMENDLWRAIEHQEFVIYYQPILSLKTGAITGFEALMRWQHPEKGFLPPSEFIPLAEETGLILPMGEWLLKAACAQNRAWQLMGFPHLKLSVNFSARQLQHPDPLKMIQNILWDTHMNAKTLILEITESIAMKSDPGFETLFKFNFMGIPIAIDDFGTGYSSLSSLKRSPATTLKIDQSFLKNVPNDLDNAAITGTIIAMARNLQLQVIAEGVETEDQVAFLRERDCDEVQGYYFSQPLSAEKATELLIKKDHFAPKLRLVEN